MENLQGGSVESCLVAGTMAGIHLIGFGPWGFLAGMVIGCAVGQLK